MTTSLANLRVSPTPPALVATEEGGGKTTVLLAEGVQTSELRVVKFKVEILAARDPSE